MRSAFAASVARGAVVALAFGGASLAKAQSAAPATAAASGAFVGRGLSLTPSSQIKPIPSGEAAKRLPIVLQANEIRGRPDLETEAIGNAELRRGGTQIRADSLSYTHPDDLAVARGNVRALRGANVYTGHELQLHVERFEGFVLEPTYYFTQFNAGGHAKRIDFLDDQRSVATNATYTSCTPDGRGQPDWLLSADKVHIDLEANEGVAEGAVLRFLGVPILGASRFTFPLSDARKSGWLPPSLNIDNRSGVHFSAPYYWNIAPNRDATLTPGLSNRRGESLGVQFRYLEPQHAGDLNLDLLPHDRTYGSDRYAFGWQNDSSLPGNTAFTANVQRVSDDQYWKDFPSNVHTLTPRLMRSDLRVDRQFYGWDMYARSLTWQVIQANDSPMVAPYERLPQIGGRTAATWGPGVDVRLETEYNRFVNPQGTQDDLINPRPTGSRMHALGSVARPYVLPYWSLTPKLSFNAASYELDRPLADGRTHTSRVIPTFSLDSAWTLERDAKLFGRAFRQTLEPRLLYVNTPYRDQSGLPNFDSAAKDFNFESIYSENGFTGVDRVADSHEVTAGVTTRMIDPSSGAEKMRLGIVQRYLLRDQKITPEGTPQQQRFSDVLLIGSTTLVPSWTLDAALQYNPDINRTARSLVGARYHPGPFRTIDVTYRLARGVAGTEQLDIGWQWPIFGRAPRSLHEQARSASSCGGALYTVGRVNYSRADGRIADSIVGFEYDAGCWIGRVVAERLSTGRSEATTRLLLQLELVGLSRLGSNPLQVLKSNIPGYQLLRDSRDTRNFTDSPNGPSYD